MGEPGHDPGELARRVTEAIDGAGVPVEEEPQGFDERLVGESERLVAAAVEDEVAVLVCGAGHLTRQPCLARPGLTAQEGGDELPGAGALEQLVEGSPLVVAPDEGVTVDAQERFGQPDGGLLVRPVPDDLAGGERLAQALELQCADRPELELDPRAGQDPDDLGADDRTRGRGGLEPRRLDHRRAEAVVVLPADVAGTDPDPDLQRNDAPRRVVPGDRALDGGGGSDRRRRGIEGGDDTVAQPFHDRAAIPRDGAADQLVGARRRRSSAAASPMDVRAAVEPT